MAQTVIGIFKSSTEAQNAKQHLLNNGFSYDRIDVAAQSESAYSDDRSSERDQDFGDRISNFFRNLFSDEDEVSRYSTAASRGTVVTVHAQTREEAEAAADILDDYGAVDVDDYAAADRPGTTTTGYGATEIDRPDNSGSVFDSGRVSPAGTSADSDFADTDSDRSRNTGAYTGSDITNRDIDTDRLTGADRPDSSEIYTGRDSAYTSQNLNTDRADRESDSDITNRNINSDRIGDDTYTSQNQNTDRTGRESDSAITNRSFNSDRIGDDTYTSQNQNSDRTDRDSDSVITNRNMDSDRIGDRGETSIPIIEENMNVGKREVQTGGKRLHSRIVERPVEETIRLREERVRVERNPADREASEQDIANFKEGTVEFTEKKEVPVVNKESRVVEDVNIYKDVDEKQEVVRETLRNTEVETDDLTASNDREDLNSDRDNDDVHREDHIRGNRPGIV